MRKTTVMKCQKQNLLDLLLNPSETKELIHAMSLHPPPMGLKLGLVQNQKGVCLHALY